MAEAFANRYGSDVLVAESRGLAPAQGIPAETIATMATRDIDVSKHLPRKYDPIEGNLCDVVVNMSGFHLPGFQPKNLKIWDVEDPYLRSSVVYAKVRDDIETKVMRLILELRKAQK